MLTPKDVTPRMLAGSPVQRRVGRDCEVSTPPPTYVYVSIVANHVLRQLELQEGILFIGRFHVVALESLKPILTSVAPATPRFVKRRTTG